MTAEPAGAGLGRYAAVLRLPSVRSLFAAAFVGRLPVGMFTLATVLLVSHETGSYAIAGAASGAFALAGAVTAPLEGRIVDRGGQTLLLTACAFVFPAAVAGLIAVANEAPHAVPVIACAALCGVAFPPLFATLRALIATLTGQLAETAFAMEAIVQELFFVVGPLLVAVLVAVATAEAALAAAAALVCGGTLAFAALPASRAWHGGRGARDSGQGALRSPGVRTLVLTSVADGMTFGMLEVAMPAFAQVHGAASTSGVLLGTLALGSMLGGVLYGARRWKRDPAELIVLFAVPMAAGLATLALADSIPAMLILLFGAGLFIAPSAAASFTLIGRLAPAGAVTEAFTWISTAVTAGFATGGAMSGALVESASVDAALLGTAGFSALAATILFARRATLAG